MKLAVASHSEIGPVRDHNADSIHTDERLGLCVIADGMGSRAEAVTASKAVVDRVRAYTEESLPCGPSHMCDSKALKKPSSIPSAILRRSVLHANETLYEENQSNPSLIGNPIGSTVAGLLWPEPAYEYLAYCHVGDSRIFVHRDGGLTSLTRDHTALESWKMAGGEGDSPNKNIINRAVGINPSLEVDVAGIKPKLGDVYILCSDGITGSLEDPTIAQLIEKNAPAFGSGLCADIVDAAKDAGCKDNLSVIVAWVEAE